MPDLTASQPPGLTKEAPNLEKTRFIAQSNAGVSLPAAGAAYWALLGAFGFVSSDKYVWWLPAAIGSGLIAPLGVMLQKPLRCDVTSSASPLGGVMLNAVIGANLMIPLYIALILNGAFDFAPLAMALGMAAHWPVAAWAYDSRAALVHAVARTGAVSLIWFLQPEWRFTILPLTVSALYLAAALFMALETTAARKALPQEEELAAHAADRRRNRQGMRRRRMQLQRREPADMMQDAGGRVRFPITTDGRRARHLCQALCQAP